ncbi:MAG: S-layer homology domain-containing protein, partial [Oscillospiraceae bacterium]|nr:S-layer homology domain-containing protein [Oscillospiraceae bacterium]
MKKLFSLLLTLVLLCSLIPAASAASPEAQQAAEALYELGLFRGNGTLPDGSPNFALDQTPTRNQAVIMLVRLLGKEEEALAGTWDIPFTDVSKASAAYPYIGYAYANKLTNGTSATTFGGGNPIRANQYITFVLRAMGYESGKDFAVSTAWEFSDSLGITKGEYNAANAGSFLRSGIAEVSYGALSAKVSGTETTLLEKLKADGAVPETAVTPTPDTGDTVPADLTFKTIDSAYYQARGYFNQLKSFQLKSFEYADGGENIYIRVNYSGNVKKFLVCPAGIPGEGGMGDMLRFDTSAANGVFTCKVSKSLFKEYPCLLISPAEDGKNGPVDYFIFMGYLQLTESGTPV